MSKTTGKPHTKRLAQFAEDIAKARRRQREHEANARGDRARLDDLRAERRAAIKADELGQQPPRPLDAIDADLAEAERAVERDEHGARAEAMRQVVPRLESEREQYVRDHADGLLAELAPDAQASADEILALATQLEEAFARREAIRQRVDAVVKLLPPPNAASTYRLYVPEDKASQAMLPGLRRGLDVLEPTLPVEMREPAAVGRAA